MHRRFDYSKYNTSFGNHFVETNKRSSQGLGYLDLKYGFMSFTNKLRYYWNKYVGKVGWFGIATVLVLCLIAYSYASGGTSSGNPPIQQK